MNKSGMEAIMSTTTNSAPLWYNKEEAECFEKIKELAKTFPSATALVIEIEGSNQVLIECKEEIPSEQNMKISQFNKQLHKLFLNYVTEDEYVEGKRYPLQ